MEEWCNSDLRTLSIKVADRVEWRQIVKQHSTPTGIESMVLDDDVILHRFVQNANAVIYVLLHVAFIYMYVQYVIMCVCVIFNV